MIPKVRIIFAPQFEPFQPYLSLPYLKELLKRYDIQSSYIDCNVDFYNWLFIQKDCLISSDNKQACYLNKNIDTALFYIKNGVDDLYLYRWAINVIEEYLQAISTDDFSISLSNLEISNKYDTEAIKKFVFSENNLLKKYFQDNVSLIINDLYSYYFFSLAVIEQLPASLIFAKEIKRLYPNTKIAFGGPFISRFHDKLKNEDWINKIVEFIEPDEGYLSIPKIFNIEKPYLGHILPDFSEINNDQYLSSKIVYPYLISCGCKWGKCVFCSHHLSYKDYRSSIMMDVVNDLKKYKNNYGIEYFSFCDEYLTKEQLKEFCLLLEKEGLDIKWSTFVKGESAFIDFSFMNNLYSNGCRVLFFGFETFNQRLLNLMKKGTNANNYLPILQSCKQSNIAVRIDIMFGFITETEEEAKETYYTITKNIELFDTPFSSIAIALFELKKDTPVYENAEKYKINILNSHRGNLDEVNKFLPKMVFSDKWREKLMRFFKNETNSEIIAPYNKTHQLILKDLFDKGLINETTILNEENLSFLIFQINSSIDFLIDQSNHILSNYANGSEIVIDGQLWKFLKQNKDRIFSFSDLKDLISPFISNTNTIYEIINFLYRNDYLTITKTDYEQQKN